MEFCSNNSQILLILLLCAHAAPTDGGFDRLNSLGRWDVGLGRHNGRLRVKKRGSWRARAISARRGKKTSKTKLYEAGPVRAASKLNCEFSFRGSESGSESAHESGVIRNRRRILVKMTCSSFLFYRSNRSEINSFFFLL